jgi:hypothetical protein
VQIARILCSLPPRFLISHNADLVSLPRQGIAVDLDGPVGDLTKHLASVHARIANALSADTAGDKDALTQRLHIAMDYITKTAVFTSNDLEVLVTSHKKVADLASGLMKTAVGKVRQL